MGPRDCVLTIPLGDSDALENLRTAVLDLKKIFLTFIHFSETERERESV